MPYIYTSAPVAGRVVQSPEYARREINAQTTGNLEQIQLIGVATEKQLAYDGYIQSLPAFLHATASRKKTYVTENNYKLTLQAEQLIPFPLPPLCVSPRTPFKKDEDKAEFQKKLGIKSEHIRYGKMDQFVIKDYTIQEFQRLPFSIINPNTPSPNDATSVLGVKGFLTSIKILTLFLATHSYAAFNSPEDTLNEHAKQSKLMSNAKFITGSSAMRGLPDNFPEKEEGERILGEEYEEYDMPENAKKPFDVSLQGVVLTAKPAPFLPFINFGPSNEAPILPGYVLPYFRGMIQPSFDSIRDVMRRFFYGCFGATTSENSAGWEEWCKHLRKWYKTNEGMMMTHVFFCIQTALEAQARLFVAMSGRRYLGVSISGYKFVISRDAVILTPEPPNKVRGLLRELDEHDKAVKVLCDMLSDVDIMDTENQEPVTSLSSTRQVYLELQRRKHLEGEGLTEIKLALSNLTFEENFWPITLDKLELALKTLFAEERINDTWPMHLPSDMVYTSSRVFQVLSAFGPMAPSLVDTSGKDFAIPKGLTAEDLLSKPDASTGKRPLESLCVAGKKLSIACSDMEFVLKNRKVKQNPTERASGYRTVMFTGGGRDTLWKILRELPFVSEDKEKRKKRARDDDQGEGGASKKKQKDNSEAFETFDDMDF